MLLLDYIDIFCNTCCSIKLNVKEIDIGTYGTQNVYILRNGSCRDV